MRKFIGVAAAALVGALVSPVALAQDSALYIGQAVKPTQFHPLLAPPGGRETRAIKRQIFDALVVQGDDLRVAPQLAESWTVTDDKVWVLKLREDAKFHNGEVFNAETVVFNLNRMLNPDSPAANSSTLRTLVESVVASGEYEVTITTKVPAPTLLTTLAFVEIPPKALIEEIGDEKFAEHPVGTGPFEFVSRDGSTVVLKRNENYWGGAPASAEVTFSTIPELATRIAALKAGEIHIADQIPPDQIGELSGSVAPMTVPGTRLYYLGMNVEVAPFNDVNVRRAVGKAIDRQLLVDSIYGGQARPLKEMAFPEMFGYDADLEGFTYDAAAAKEVLSAITEPVKVSVRQVDLVLAQATVGFLQQAGLKAEVEVVEDAAFGDMTAAGTGQAFVSSWGVAEGDVDAILAPHFWSGRGDKRHFTNYSNPEIDRLFEEGRSTTDAAKREEIYSKALAILVEDAPWAPLVNPSEIYGVSTQVTGWAPSSTGMYRINEAAAGK
jgi:peptide/nickel transport system substrate-binding protein